MARKREATSMDGLLGFVLAALALAGSPGPSNISLAAVAAAFGARKAGRYMAGIVTGMVLVMAITASGMVGVLLAVPGAAQIVTVLAAAYFAYLAWRIATAPPLSQESGIRHRPSFAAGILLSLVNPKGYAAMAALFSGFVLLRDQVVADAAVKLVLLSAIVLVVNLAWLHAGAALTRQFHDPRASRIINVTFAVLLVVSLAALVI